MRVTIDEELLRLALIHAEGDRESYSQCDPGPDGEAARELAARFRKLRLRLFGRTAFEAAIDGAHVVELDRDGRLRPGSTTS